MSKPSYSPVVEQRLRILFDEAPVAYHEIDTEAVIVSVNRAECELFGYSSEEMTGRHVWEFVAPEERAQCRETLRLKLARELPTGTLERRFLRRDGEILTAQIHDRLLCDEAGTVLGLYSAQVDLTANKRQEAVLARQAAELARSNAELEQFAYVASHDLQEPLRMVASYTQLLARRYRGRLDSDADEFIAFAVDGASRMQVLINDLLAYSRVGTRACEPRPTALDGPLAKALANLRQSLDETGAVVTHDALPTVPADAGQLVQLFEHLVGNALKFRARETPRIHVGAAQESGFWRISLEDNGIGIDPKYAQRIFQVFQRLHTQADYPGTGIGLAICKKIVERHGGRIWVDPRPGQGSCFCFTIPVLGGGHA